MRINTIIRKQRQRFDRPVDEGMTLIEIMVALGLFTLLSAMVCAITILSIRVSNGTTNRLDNAEQGSISTDAASKVLRTAVLPEQLTDQVCNGCADTALVQANRQQVTFYANLNNTGNGPSLITLKVIQDPYASSTNQAELLQTIQPPTVVSPGIYTFCNPGSNGCVVRSRVLARGLAWPAQNVFNYYDSDGDIITDNPLTANDLSTITSIELNYDIQTVKGAGSNYPASSVNTRVRLPNADINVFTDDD